MKNMYRLSLFALAIFVVGCEQPSREASTKELKDQVDQKEQSDSLYYELSTFYKEYGDCTMDSAVYCTRINLNYPQFEAEANKKPVTKINEQIETHMIDQFFPETTENKSVELFADQFISDYKEIKAAFGEAFGWYAKMDGKVLRNDTTVVTIELTADLYTGGAHGNVTVQYMNFDPNTGSKIVFDSLFKPGYDAKLNEIVEKEFRQKHALSPDTDLSDEGFQFENEQYYNKDNFALLPDGIKFYYNNYEIAPYSSGPSEVVVRYEKLKDIMRGGQN